MYKLMIAESLLESTKREVQSVAPVWEQEETASLLCLPSFEPEWALSVVGDRKARFWVVVAEAEKNIWYSMAVSEEMSNSPYVKTHWTEVTAELGAAVCDTWNGALCQTHYAQEPFCGCDGVTYHFAYVRKGKQSEMAGQTWSPDENTVPGKLVALSYALKEYAEDVANQDVFRNVIKDHLEWFRTNSYF
jgi:hypothetical protein